MLAEQVKSTGDNEAAMQVMIERHQVLLEEQHLIASGHFDGRLPASTIATLRARGELPPAR